MIRFTFSKWASAGGRVLVHVYEGEDRLGSLALTPVQYDALRAGNVANYVALSLEEAKENA